MYKQWDIQCKSGLGHCCTLNCSQQFKRFWYESCFCFCTINHIDPSCILIPPLSVILSADFGDPPSAVEESHCWFMEHPSSMRIWLKLLDVVQKVGRSEVAASLLSNKSEMKAVMFLDLRLICHHSPCSLKITRITFFKLVYGILPCNIQKWIAEEQHGRVL